MCELFGINAPDPCYANKWLEAFFAHSEEHYDGWGLAEFHYGAPHHALFAPFRACEQAFPLPVQLLRRAAQKAAPPSA